MKIESYFKKVFLVMIVVGLFYAGVTSVFGVQGATSISVGQSSRANFTNYSSSASTPVQAGNVTELNLSGGAITEHWAGFYGEISGNISLSNSDGDVFYNWAGLGAPEGEVFASNESSVDWSGVGCAASAEITGIQNSLGITGTDPDRIELTYPNNNHPAIDIGTVTGITGCNSTNTYVNGAPDAASFYQLLLTDTDGTPIYTTMINDSTVGFDGSTHDFQLLVGESDAAGTTSLYFYLELS